MTLTTQGLGADEGSGGSNAISAITTNTSTPPTTETPRPTTGSSTRTARDTRPTSSTSARNNFNNLSRIDTGDSNTKGENETFGYVIGTRSEKLTNGKVYNEFKDLLMTYVGSDFKNGDDIACLIRELKDPEADLVVEHTPDKPKKGADGYDHFEMEEWKMGHKMFLDRKMVMHNNIKKLYALVWGQCTQALKSELMGLEKFEENKKKSDSLWLLENIKIVSAGVDSTANAVVTYHNQFMNVSFIRQSATESMDDYMNRFNSMTATTKLVGAENIWYCEKLFDVKMKDASEAEIKESEEKVQAIFFLLHGDKQRFGARIRELERGMHAGRDEWPTTVVGAYHLMVRTQEQLIAVETRLSRSNRRGHGRGGGAQFAQDGSHRGGRSGGRFQRTGRGGGRYQPPAVPEGVQMIPGSDGATLDLQCYKCFEWGHIAPNCPVANPVGNQHLMKRLQLTQDGVCTDIPRSWILLDTCSSNSTCNDARHVENIKQCIFGEEMTTITNGGPRCFEKEATLNIFPLKVYFDQESLATIVSYYEVSILPGVTMIVNSKVENTINVVVEDQNCTYKFRPCGSGLYYVDIDAMEDHCYELEVTDNSYVVAPYSLVQSVASNRKFLARNEISDADKALYYQELLGWPSMAAMKTYVKDNLLKNCDVTIDDIVRSEQLYGKAVPELKGKMRRANPVTHADIARVPLPPILKGRCLHLFIDIIYVNKIAFFVSKTRHVNFIMVTTLKSRSAKHLIDAVHDHINKYEARGFEITDVHGDNEFNFPEFDRAIRPSLFHSYAKNEHVGPIENCNKVIKERGRAIVNGLPYDKYPKLMVVSLVEHVTDMLNSFPSKESISCTMSPAMIVEGKPKIDLNQKRLPYGAYAQVWIGTKNNMTERAVPGIALKASNSKGGFYFMSLYTGRRINSYVWEVLPISDEIIERVGEIAKQQKQPKIINGIPIFEWDSRNNNRDDLDNNDQENVQEENDENENENDNEDGIINNQVTDEEEVESTEEEVENDDEESLQINEIQEYEEEEQESMTQDEEETESSIIDNDKIEIDVNDFNVSTEQNEENTMTIGKDNEELENPTESEFFDEAENNNEKGSIMEEGIRHSVRIKGGVPKPSRFNNAGIKGKYTQATQFLMKKEAIRNEKTFNNLFKTTVDVMFTQMSAKRGIKLFKERAVAAMIKELTQLDRGAMDGKPVVIPIDPKLLTSEERKLALEAVHLIKEKRDGKVKGRTCANGSKQRQFLKEGETVASPAVSMEGIFLTFLIAAYEGRKVVSFDIPGAFLQAEMSDDKLVLLKFRDDFVDMMCQVNPEHKKNVIIENGKRVLYMKIVRGLYGCIEAALQWYKCYTEILEKEGFVLNPYDKCVANKEINGEQCTISWYVDDNVITHKDESVLKNVFSKICEAFGAMDLNTGDTHDFLGMNIKIDRTNKNIEVSMKDQLQETIDLFKSDYGQLVNRYTSPAGHHLFEVDENASLLDEKRKELFHTITAKLLYIMKRARPDIELTISFLCTRVRNPSEDDWKKLQRVLGWCEATIEDVRIIGANSLEQLFTWIDASYGVHMNMRGHTGGAISMGYGLIHARAGKQKINTKSSTESELVGVAEYIPYNLWILMFLEEQGYGIKDNVIYQDNKSAILMEQNGRNSCTGNSRHINIRYFFIKDRSDKGEIRVQYCPTGLMLADYYTKPLMEAKFREFRSYVMGWRNINELVRQINDPDRIKERVGISENTNIPPKKVIPSERTCESRT